MRRRGYLAASGSLAVALAEGAAAVRRRFATGGFALLGAEADVEVRIAGTNAPVEGGDLLEVTVEVENVGDGSARPTIESTFDGEPGPSVTTTVDPGETRTVDYFTHRTYPVGQTDEIAIRVETERDADERSVEVLGVERLDPDRTHPDGELAVQPGTSVFFEVESDALGEYGGRTQWFVDGEYVGWSMGPWHSTYYGHRGADYWRTSFESTGTREVAAAVGDDETYRATWTIDVTEDGVASPGVAGSDPDEESLSLVRGEPTDLAIEVTDPDGALDRVVWWLGHADVILGESEVSGADDVASLELEGGCYGCPIIAWVIGERGTIASESPWVIDEIVDGDGVDPAVTIVGTNDPVDAGDLLEVTVDLENGADAALTREVDLIVGHDPELVDSRTVTIAGGGVETVTLEFRTATVRRSQTFPARVECGSRADEVSVHVVGTDDATLDVSIASTNSPVETGEYLEVTTELANDRGSALTREPQLVVGYDPDVVDAELVTVEPGESEIVTMGYETALVENDQQFPVRVETEGDADEDRVLVYVDEPPILVSILETNEPVTTGDLLEVTAELENVAGSSESQTVELIVGHDPELVDDRTVTVPGGAAETVTMEFETALVRRTQQFPIRVAGEDDAAVRDVLVFGTEDVDVSVTIVEANDPVDAGDVLEVTAAVENRGTVEATQDLEFVVGHDPTVVDAASVRIGPGETETIQLAFETANVENDQEFPVRVESAVAGDERSVLVRGTDGEGDEDENGDPDQDPELAVVDYSILGSDPDEEYVTIRNVGDETLDASGWTVRDRRDGGRVAANQLSPLSFPDGFTLEPGGEVTIVSGSGTATDDTLYWEYGGNQIWNEDGDVVIVLDADGEMILEQEISADPTDQDPDSADRADQDSDPEDTDPDDQDADNSEPDEQATDSDTDPDGQDPRDRDSASDTNGTDTDEPASDPDDSAPDDSGSDSGDGASDGGDSADQNPDTDGSGSESDDQDPDADESESNAGETESDAAETGPDDSASDGSDPNTSDTEQDGPDTENQGSETDDAEAQ